MRALGPALLCLVLAACDRGDGVDSQPIVDGVRQTGAPGHVRAGGHTSGQVMAATAPAASPSDRGPAGTPGIPQGAGGTTSGVALGGTAQANPVAPASAPEAPTKTTGVSEAERQALALEASMDAVAARWRARAAAGELPVPSSTATDAQAGFQAEAEQSGPAGQPQGRLTEAGAAAPKRSEKAGTAPLSPDVNKAVKPPSDPGVGADAPDAAN